MAGLLLAAFVAVAAVAWWRSPARVEYRIDRRALRRLRRRWRGLRQTEDLADDVRVRRVDHLLALATQACGARWRGA